MNAAGPPFQSQAKLWLTAFVVSALINALLILAIGFWVVANLVIHTPRHEAASFESVALIVPQVVAGGAIVGEEEAAPAVPPPAEPSFARTSPDQVEEKPDSPDFIGERNTRATSDAAPLAEAPDLPRQKGREPRWEDEIETTESDYQDGDLAHNQSATPDSPAMQQSVVPPAEPLDPADPVQPPASDTGVPPLPEPPLERLAEGPVPVDRRVKESPEPEELPKPAPPERSEEGKEEPEEPEKPVEPTQPATPAPESPSSPGFRGNQKKTRLEGSISRLGRSALDVEDSLLGRYHAAVSRAVEKEWQRNCVRNRDYITPGQLTMRVMLEASGKVRSVGFMEELGVGNIPKGFTLNSIRDAEIPAMPGELKKQLDGEPLELIYRFNF
ncbi:MAG: hypothetical protein B9S38_04015 [Verrucomicrobiia bacterium Tous-C4TDCM]|nr:MAG: hypothetical protein B9S38_04015 [Verrucomicrobiae bacterium Tous-C4TDCM]